MRRAQLVRIFVPIVLVVCLLAGRGVADGRLSKAELEQRVKASYQEKLNEQYASASFKVIVTGVTLVSSGHNNYVGTVYVSIVGSQREVSISVTYDGDSIAWSAEPIS
jgi:hypothetical protein